VELYDGRERTPEAETDLLRPFPWNEWREQWEISREAESAETSATVD
jgi:hypothetical protein